MVKLYLPKLDDLWFRQMFMSDEETMSYNHHWGGTIPFPEENWADWYDYWILNPEGKRFYRCLRRNCRYGETVTWQIRVRLPACLFGKPIW